MGKKKYSKFKLNISKKQRKKLILYATPILVGILSLGIGIIGTRIFDTFTTHKNIVWASDATVDVPNDLRKYLMSRDDCRDYRDLDNVDGVGLWGVYQVSKSKFAKIAYGCSWSLTSYIMAIKQPSGWSLIPPTEYFAQFNDSKSTGALPLCGAIEKFSIDKNIEPFCVNVDGSAKANLIE